MKRSTFENRDGFQVHTEKEVTLPQDTSDLDPVTKRAFTICNLFVNHKLSISDIIRVLDEEHGSVVMALLEQGIILERRQRRGTGPEGSERRRVVRVNS
jgi:hypothetical protein